MATLKSFKQKIQSAVVEAHSDEVEDEKLVGRMVDKAALKKSAIKKLKDLGVKEGTVDEVSAAASGRAAEGEWRSSIASAPAAKAPNFHLKHNNGTTISSHHSAAEAFSAWGKHSSPGSVKVVNNAGKAVNKGGSVIESTDYSEILEMIVAEMFDQPMKQEDLSDVKKAAEKLSSKAHKFSDEIEDDDSAKHAKAVNLHAMAAHEHRKALNMTHDKINSLNYQIREASHPMSISNIHPDLLSDLQEKRNNLENDSFDHSNEIARHHREITYHSSHATNEDTEQMTTLKSLIEMITENPFDKVKQAAAARVTPKKAKKYGDDGDDEPTHSSSTSKNYSGALGDALGIKPKNAPSRSDLTRGELKGIGKVTRHVCKEDVEYSVYKIDTNKFAARITENEEVIFECIAPTEVGAISMMDRIIENTISKIEESKSTIDVAKSVAKRVISK